MTIPRVPSELTRQEISVGHKKKKPFVIWLVGLSGAGKTTTANSLSKRLSQMGRQNYLLDGDVLRSGLCADLDFSSHGRLENLRRASEVAKLFHDAGIIVIASFITPLESHRVLVRSKFFGSNFIEVFCSANMQICEKRDPKGLYASARMGNIANFTGVCDTFEEPKNSEVVVDTGVVTVDEACQVIIEELLRQNLLME
jgi:adenylylsulfate kinase